MRTVKCKTNLYSVNQNKWVALVFVSGFTFQFPKYTHTDFNWININKIPINSSHVFMVTTTTITGNSNHSNYTMASTVYYNGQSWRERQDRKKTVQNKHANSDIHSLPNDTHQKFKLNNNNNNTNNQNNKLITFNFNITVVYVVNIISTCLNNYLRSERYLTWSITE